MDTSDEEKDLRQKFERVRDPNSDTSIQELETLGNELREAGMYKEAFECLTIFCRKREEFEEKRRLEVEEFKEKTRLEHEEKTRREEEKNELLLRRAIRLVYFKDDGSPSCPSLMSTGTATPSLEGHALPGMGDQLADYVNEVEGGVAADEEPLAKALEIVVPTTIAELRGSNNKAKTIPSEFDPTTPLKYVNEIAVQFHVQSMVKDAIRCLGCEEHLEANMEVSFFGVTPDIIIVTLMKKIIFVIEVKSPDPPGKEGNDKVCINQKVAGQIWIYLQMMESLGVPVPMGAICTFNELRLVWLPTLSNGATPPPFKKAWSMLQSEVATPFEVSQEDKKPAISPEFKTVSASEILGAYNRTKPEELFTNENYGEIEKGVYVFTKAELKGGKIARDSEVFRHLLLGIKAAMLANEENNTSNIVQTVSAGEDFGSRPTMLGTEPCIKKGFTKQGLKIAEGMPTLRCKNFHMISRIGRGQVGDVHLALSTSGNPCAVKFFRYSRSFAATEKDRQDEYSQAIKQITQTRDEEWAKWKELYPEDKYPRYKNVRKLTLNKVPCLLMPFGRSLNVSELDEHMKEAEKELLRFSELGYVYREVRLRHVLLDEHGNILLVDLGSLVKIDDIAQRKEELKVSVDQLVTRQNERRRDRQENRTPVRRKRESDTHESSETERKKRKPIQLDAFRNTAGSF